MLAWISLAALFTAVTLSMFTKMNVGVVSLAFAWIVGVYLGRAAAQRGDRRVSDPAVSDARRCHAAVRDGACQRHARAAGRTRRAPVLWQRRHHSHHVLPRRAGAFHDRAGQHRDGRAARTHGHGDRPSRGRAAISHDPDGRQRRAGGCALPVRAHRRHRQWRHGAHRAGRRRVADLREQPARAPRHHLRSRTSCLAAGGSSPGERRTSTPAGRGRRTISTGITG